MLFYGNTKALERLSTLAVAVLKRDDVLRRGYWKAVV